MAVEQHSHTVGDILHPIVTGSEGQTTVIKRRLFSDKLMLPPDLDCIPWESLTEDSDQVVHYLIEDDFVTFVALKPGQRFNCNTSGTSVHFLYPMEAQGMVVITEPSQQSCKPITMERLDRGKPCVVLGTGITYCTTDFGQTMTEMKSAINDSINTHVIGGTP